MVTWALGFWILVGFIALIIVIVIAAIIALVVEGIKSGRSHINKDLW